MEEVVDAQSLKTIKNKIDCNLLSSSLFLLLQEEEEVFFLMCNQVFQNL
jgi:hypothetical protein